MGKSCYLSIIIPCYNGENTIDVAIQSIISQGRKDIELIIVNDGSRDNTDAICKKYSQFNDIQYIYIENSGAGYARNVGISKANGTWVAFLDADDLFLENSLNLLIPKLHEYDMQGVDVIYTSTIKGDMQQNNSKIRTAEPIDIIDHIPQHEFWSCLYRKQFLDSYNIRFFEYKEQDVETAFRYRVFSHNPNAVTDNSLTFYFQRNNPNSNTHTWKEDILHRVKSRVYLELLEENSKKKEDLWLLEVVLREVSYFYINIIKYGCSDSSFIAYVNSTHNRAFRKSIKVKKRRNTYFYLFASVGLRLLGNTIGKRKRK